LLPLLFVAAAFLSAAAVLAVLAAAVPGPARSRETAFLGRLTLGLLGVTLLIEWADVSVAFYSSNLAAWDAYKLALTGPYWWVFWLVHLLAGIAVPIVLLAWKPRSLGAVAIAGGLVAMTLVALRLNVVIPGLAVPQIEGLDEAFVESGLTRTYFPSLLEWLVALFGAAIFIGVMGGWWLLAPFRFEVSAAPAAATVRAARSSTTSRSLFGVRKREASPRSSPRATHGPRPPRTARTSIQLPRASRSVRDSRPRNTSSATSRVRDTRPSSSRRSATSPIASRAITVEASTQVRMPP